MFCASVDVYERLIQNGKKPGFFQLLATQTVSAVWHVSKFHPCAILILLNILLSPVVICAIVSDVSQTIQYPCQCIWLFLRFLNNLMSLPIDTFHVLYFWCLQSLFTFSNLSDSCFYHSICII